MSQFRTIALCNVAYKVVSKIVDNHLQRFMHDIISGEQGSFIKGRLISDNFIIASEVFHSIQGKESTSDSVALKLDITKAFDKLEWRFLREMLLRLDFMLILLTS